MGKGKRYDEPKLNLKKVFGTIITILVIIMIIVTINKILSKEADKIRLEKSKYFPTYVDGKWGVIDQYGNVVVDPKYNLGDINKIEVIGKWHLAENVNMTYYICE